jgi:hypothetical protein
MLSAPKLWKSSSISGPSTTWKPMATKMSTISSSIVRSGCTWPRGRARPGRVTSMRSSTSARSSAADASAAVRASSASVTAPLHLVREGAHGGTLVGRELTEAPQDLVQRAAATEVLEPQRLQRVHAVDGGDLRQGRLAELREHGAHDLRRRAGRGLRYRAGSGAFGQGGELAERLGIVQREGREHLAIDLDRRRLQPGHEPAVRQPCFRAAALMRMIQRLRKSRFFCLRSRYA